MPFETLKDLAEQPWEWPDDAGETILAVLQDSKAAISDRVLAAEFAGDITVINDELVDALLAILRSDAEPAELRAQAAISFGPVLEESDLEFIEEGDELLNGGFGDLGAPSIDKETFHMLRDALRRLYQDSKVPSDVRRSILEAAVRSPQDWQYDAVQAAWASNDADWKRTAVFCMGHVNGFDEPILEALKSGKPDLHYEAVRAAGSMQLDEAWDHIVPLLKLDTPEEGKPLLLAAIEAVAYIRPSEAPDVLGDLMDTEDEEILEAIDDALAMAEACADPCPDCGQSS